ncbi:hypothetical protein J2S55_009299 [Streptosporangium brasiliense]|uniref:Uncharacterized protein n=1 Tax=Streptosporangium brasiliense TaxID=47480 RepID=A0ABT9RL47_9ACTN|nr:hypothetical protein [Streptosporangium brasiliense]
MSRRSERPGGHGAHRAGGGGGVSGRTDKHRSAAPTGPREEAA